jgi:hypothetical protein
MRVHNYQLFKCNLIILAKWPGYTYFIHVGVGVNKVTVSIYRMRGVKSLQS